jgi:DNA-binding transcriptional regulator GbsR (MarR family)
MEINKGAQQFILHWGEMGAKWGINRSVAQIHALLYIQGRAMPADEICEALSIARSNVSTGLRELEGWGLVRVAHKMGDRRDHFEALSDVWETFCHILAERKRREADPTLRLLRDTVQGMGSSKSRSKEDGIVRDRLSEMLEFFELANKWGERATKLSPKMLKRLAQMGDAVFKLAGG